MTTQPNGNDTPRTGNGDGAQDVVPAPEAGAGPAEQGARRKPLKLSRWFWALVLVLLAAGAALSQTGPGQRLVLDTVLDRVRGALAGELTIETMRSGTLLTGATLIGVRLDAEGGRRFLTADSVVIRYTPVGLFFGRPRSLVVWGLDLEISRYTEDEEVNVAGLLREPEAQGQMSEPRSSPPPVRFGRIGVREGLVSVLNPARPGTAGVTVPAPDGEGRLSRIAFENLDLDLEEVVLFLDGSEDPFRARLASLSMNAAILEDPLRVDEAFGSVVFGRTGLRVSDAAFRMPGSLLRGALTLGPRETEGPWILDARLATEDSGDLADLAWLDPRVPDGAFTGSARLTVGDETVVRLEEVRLQLEASTLAADGVVKFDDEMSFEALDLTASPLALSRLEPWTGRPAPVDGWLSGQVRVTGTLARVVATGRLTLVPTGFGGAPTTADFSGTFFTGTNPGVRDLEARLNPVNYQLAQAFAPGVRLQGRGSVDLEVSGRSNDAVTFVASALHRADGLSDSRASARGSLRRGPNREWSADVRVDLTEFSLGMLGETSPAAEFGGELTGSFAARGRLRDLQVEGEVEAAGGIVSIDGVFDMRRPGSFYRFDAIADQIALSTFSGRLPDPSFWSGRLSVEGRGLKPDSMDAALTLRSSQARLGGLHVDTATAHMRASSGILTVDSLDAVVGGIRFTGDGRLGMAAPLDGEARLAFSAETIAGLRPLWLGDTVTAKDTLSAVEVTLLSFEGVDVAALPDTMDVRLGGRADGTVRLVGSVDALDVELALRLTDAVYGPNQLDSAALTMTARDLPGLDGEWDIDLDAYGVEYEGRTVAVARFDGTMLARRGDISVWVDRQPGNDLRASGDFVVDSAGGRIGIADATVTVDSLGYDLARPASIMWDSASIEVRDLEISRLDDDPMRITANGRLSRTGESDFSMEVEGLHLERVARLLESNGVDMGGHADLSLTIRGPAGDPRIQATWAVFDPRLDRVTLTRLSGDFDYASRKADFSFDAWSQEDRVFTAGGTVPVDLRLGEVEDRLLSEPMDVSVEADSLTASVALAYFQSLEDVSGRISGAVRVRGTLESPEPEGSVQLAGGAWSIEAVGVRHRDVNGTVEVRPDRTLIVDLRTNATGSSTVTGSVRLEPLTDPTFDLAIRFGRFQVVDRSDMEGRVSGDLTLGGRFQRPRITGSLRVDQGTLFVDEFARNAAVVDLSDPRLFGPDTTIFETQPLLRSLQNPFLQSLQVEVDLSVPRDTWLRSDDMNVEMGGELFVRYDRIEGDIVLVGELQALRGSYTVLGRTFEVTGGTVGFIGTPGVNPTLDIQASSLIRRLQDEPLEVNATVEGTLTVPQVSLSTEEAGLVQSDLISYLIFGRSSSELATGQSRFLQGAAGSVAGAAISGATTFVSGAVAARVGAALAQGIGVDYLSISQAGDFAFAEFSSPLANTQLEIGQYVGRDAFIVLVLRPLRGQDTGLNFLGGARVEYALTEDYTVEAFFEDRFLRRGRSGFGGLGVPASQIVGVFIFRELGY